MDEDVKSYYAQLKDDIIALFSTSVSSDKCVPIMEKYGYDCLNHNCYECRVFLFKMLDNYIAELESKAEAGKPGEKIQNLIDKLDAYVDIDPSDEGFKFFKNESFYKDVMGEKQPFNTSSYYDEYYAFRTLLVKCQEPNDTIYLPLDKNGVPCNEPLSNRIKETKVEKNNRTELPKMTANELADKIQEQNILDIYRCIENVFDLSYNTPIERDIEVLCDAIRNIDVSEDYIKYPLDADGTPIKIGDTVYIDGEDYKVETIKILSDELTGELYFDIIGMGENKSFSASPKLISHVKSRTLDDVIKEMQDAFNHDLLRIDLIKEAYEMGKADKNE